MGGCELNLSVVVRCKNAMGWVAWRWLFLYYALLSNKVANTMCCYASTRGSLLLKQQSHSATQHTPHLLWNLRAHYHVYKSLRLVSILNKVNQMHKKISHGLSSQNNFSTSFEMVLTSLTFHKAAMLADWYTEDIQSHKVLRENAFPYQTPTKFHENC
jgi:hypothetical protein